MVLVALAMVTALAWTQRLWIAERAAIALLTRAGIGPVALRIERLDFNSVRVSNLAIGGEGGQKIAELNATYSLADLRNGVVEEVKASGLRLHGKWGPEGLSLQGLPTHADSGEKGDSFGLPIRVMDLEDIHANIETPFGTASLVAAGRINTPDGNASDVDASFQLQTQLADGSGTLRGRVTATRFASGEAFGQVLLKEGEAKGEAFSATTIGGQAQFIILPDRAPELDARLDIAELTIAGEPLHDSHIAVGLRRSDAGQIIEVVFTNPDGRVNALGTVAEDDKGATSAAVTITADITRGTIRAKMEGNGTASIAADGRITGALRIDEGDLALAGSAVSGLQANGTFARARDGTVEGEASATLQSFGGYGLIGQPTSMSVRVSKDIVDARGDIAWKGGTLAFRAQGPPAGPVGLAVNGKLNDVPSSTLIPEGYRARGSAAFALKGAVPDPVNLLASIEDDPVAILKTLEIQGWIESDLDTVTLPSFLSGGTLSGRIDLTSNPDGLQITTNNLHASTMSIAPEIIPPPLRAYLAGSSTNVSIKGDANATFDWHGSLKNLESTKITANLAGDQISGQLDLSQLFLKEHQLHSAYRLAGAFNGSVNEAIAPVKATAKLSGQAGFDGTIVSLSVAPKSAISVTSLVVPDKVETQTPVSLNVASPTVIKLDTAKGLSSLAYAATLVIPENRLRIKTEEDWLEATLSPTKIEVRGSGTNPRVHAKSDLIEVAAYKLQASGLDLKLDLADKSALAFSVDGLRHTDAKPFVVPLRLTASAAHSENRITFEGRLFDPPEQLSIQLRGHHDQTNNKGTASVDMRKVTFLPTVLQPVQLFPFLGRTLKEVDGEVDALADFAWGDGQFDSSLELLVTAASLKADEFTLENAATVVQFDNLFPPSTPPNQEISIGALDIGIPLLNGRAEFQLKRDGRIEGALRELDFFGGRIETEAFTIPKSFDGFTVPLLVNGAELEDLLQLVQPQDLDTTGTLNGRIPIVVENGQVIIRGGVLESADGGGHIRYRPDKEIRSGLGSANEGMDLLLQIVDDFTYESARVTLDEDAFGDVAFRFQIKGNNPSVYKGIPVHLNVAVDGPLRKIVSQGLKTYALPERLLSRIQEFKDAPQ